MVLIIIQTKSSEPEIIKVNRQEFMIMQTARRWYNTGNWGAIKNLVYSRGLHKNKSKKKVGFLSRWRG